MKKLIYFVFIFIIPLAFIFNINTYDFYELFKNVKENTFCFIYNNEDLEFIDKSLLLNNTAIKPVNNGSKQFIYFNDINALPCGVSPEYMQVEGELTYKEIENLLEKLNAKIVRQETVCGIKILYCFTTVWQNYKLLNNVKINLQIAIADVVTIGYPMIYGAF